MDKTEFIEGIHILQNSYNQKFSKEKLQIWWEDLKEIDKDKYINAIKSLKSKNKYINAGKRRRTYKSKIKDLRKL